MPQLKAFELLTLQKQGLRGVSLFGIALLTTLTGCISPSALRKAEQQDEAVARSYVDLLRNNKLDQIEAAFDPTTAPNDIGDLLVQMEKEFPPQEPLSVKLVGGHKYSVKDNSTTSVTLEYEFPQKWMAADITVQQIDGVSRITGFYVRNLKMSVEEYNRFTLRGKNLEQYTVLLLSILSPLFCVYAFIVCLKTKIDKRKWLWLIFVFLGVGEFGVNWSTARSILTPFSVHLPSGGAQAAQFSPWIVYASLPLGAILFLYKRHDLAKR